MNSENTVLDVVTKIMNEESTVINSCEREFYRLKNLLYEDLVECLDQGYYNNNSAIVSQVNSLCDEILFFEGVNELLDKTVINLVSSVEDARELLHRPEDISEIFDSNESIPMFLLGNQEIAGNKIVIINFADKKIELSLEEAGILLEEIQNSEIEIRKLIKAFVVQTNAVAGDVCVCIWPDKILDDIDFKRYLFRYGFAKYMYTVKEKKIHNKFLRYGNQKFFIVCDLDRKTSILETLTERQQKRVEGFVSKNKVYERIKKGGMPRIDYYITDALENILLDVERYYRKSISEFKESERLLKEDSVHLNDGQVKRAVNENAKLIRSKRKQYEEFLEKYMEVYRSIIGQAVIFQNTRQKEYGLEKDRTKYASLAISDNFFKLVSMREWGRARECLSLLKQKSDVLGDLCDIYLQYYETKRLNKEQLNIIRSCGEQSEDIAKIKINLCEILNMDDQAIVQNASFLKVPETGLEYYAVALLKINQMEYREAADYLKAAWYENVMMAGEKLLELVLDYPAECDVTQLELANMMIPSANLLEGLETYRNLDNKDNIAEYQRDKAYAEVNLKIAASHDCHDAIKIIADLLFEQCKDISWEETKKQEVKDNISNVIRLYEHLNESDPKVEYQEHIGLMYCKLGDFKRAINLLKDLDTPEACYQCALMYEYGDGVAMDLHKARSYFRKCGDRLDASIQALQISEQIRGKERNNKNASNNGYGQQREEVSVENSGFCFITTAACLALNESRDCEQLNILRRFRDQHISDGGGIGDQLIAEYYRIGPSIVNKINCEWNPRAIYSQLWDYYILPSCNEINYHNWENAKNIYIEMVKRLCEKYKLAVDSNIMKIYDIKI